MKITKITRQVKRTDRYSIYVDSEYTFSLSEGALIESKIASGQELSLQEIDDFKKLSNDDKLYNNALRYVAMRTRTVWEVKTYLERKQSPAPLIEQITNKLLDLGLVDDATYAQSFVNDRRLLRPASRRKIIMELRKKHIAGDIIEAVVGSDKADERTALREIIVRKRRQSKYQDDQKLMQYLARQGFGYDDIKSAFQNEDEA